MNCLEFESQKEVLVRGTLADARTRAAAEAHAESCDTCAARLADERALSVGLRALVAEMKTAEAPAHAEASLLTAFRARTASAGAKESSEAAAGGEVVPLSGHAPARHLSWAKTIAVASMAAAASLALFVLLKSDTPHQAAAPQQKAMIVEPPTNSYGSPSTRAVSQSDSPDIAREGVNPAPEVVKDRIMRPAFTPRPRPANISYTNRDVSSRSALADTGRAQEVATEFIPLAQAGPYAQAEEGHLVRVDLPRSALASFGLPVNAETPGGRVKADVLMGQDGIARAIRFVR